MIEICSIPKECLQKKGDGSCKSGIVCAPIVEKCNGCNKAKENYCISYPKPYIMWRLSEVCPHASHMMYQSDKIDTSKTRSGQQKQKKKK